MLEVVLAVDNCKVRVYSICQRALFAGFGAVRVGIDCIFGAAAVAALDTGQGWRMCAGAHSDLKFAVVEVAEAGKGS